MQRFILSAAALIVGSSLALALPSMPANQRDGGKNVMTAGASDAIDNSLIVLVSSRKKSKWYEEQGSDDRKGSSTGGSSRARVSNSDDSRAGDHDGDSDRSGSGDQDGDSDDGGSGDRND